jgi:LmbE family N-acetylglucosaminyl deacetylase
MEKMIYLFLDPHPDDVELCCGATICKLKGNEIHIAILSDCDLPEDEISGSHDVLGVTTHYRYFTNRRFSEQRQEILDCLIELNDKIKPDVVFIPDLSDIHQDHQVIGWEALRAFKLSADIISYAHPHNQLTGDHNYFVKVNQEQVNEKIKALSKYRSQLGRFYFKRETIEGTMRYYGVKCGAEYAEAFKIIKKYN